VIQESVVEQEASSDFLAETSDIAKGKDRSKDEKYEAKATRFNRFLNHERYNAKNRKDPITLREERAGAPYEP